MNKGDPKQVERLMALPQYAGGIRERSSISPLRCMITAHLNPSRKRGFSKTLLKPKKYENAASRFDVDGSFENDEVLIIRILPCPT